MTASTLTKANLARGKLLIVSTFFPPYVVGGAEVVAHRFALMMRELGWQVEVFAGRIASDSDGQGGLNVENADGIRVYRMGLMTLDPRNNFDRRESNAYFRSILNSFRPDVVHFHNTSGLGASLIRIAKNFGAKVAVTLHDNWGFCLTNTRLNHRGDLCERYTDCYQCLATIPASSGEIPIRFRQDYVAACLESADVLISPSADLARAYSRAGFLNHIEVLSNGIDLQHIDPRERRGLSECQFLCAAYLGEHKGIDVLLDAVGMLNNIELTRPWSLVLAGDGHLASRVKERIEAEHLAARIQYVGKLERRDLLDVLSTCEAVIVPSIWPENEPVILLEAVASGAALIATNLGGNPDILNSDEGGIAVPPKDAVSLAAAMKELIQSPEKVRRFSTCNLARRSTFDERVSGQRLDRLLRADTLIPTPKSLKVVCAGGIPDPIAAALLQQSTASLGNLRFIWVDWTDEETWKEAAAFWWIGNDVNIADLVPGLVRGLPLFLHDGPTARELQEVARGVRAYASLPDLYLQLSDLGRSCRPDVFEPPIVRAINLFRNRQDFYFRAESHS